MAFQTGGFFALQTLLAGFKARFCFCSTLLFQLYGANFCFFLTEVLHQRDITRAYPRAGAALDTVRKIMRSRFIVLLPFTEPVKLLRQQVRRAGVGAGAATYAVLFFLRFAHFCAGWCQQAVSDFYHRHVKPGQGKAHQRATHDHQLIAGRAETAELQQMTHWRTKPRPDVARSRNGFACEGDDTFSQRFAIDDRTLNGICGADVVHQHADVG